MRQVILWPAFRGLMMGCAFIGAALLAGTQGASASCENITNPFAYNECLAKEGPQKKVHTPGAKGGDPEATVRGRGTGRYASRRSRFSPSAPDPFGGQGISITRRGEHRTSAVIDPWAAVKSGYGGGKRSTARSKRHR
jgi:hypothetical protein